MGRYSTQLEGPQSAGLIGVSSRMGAPMPDNATRPEGSLGRSRQDMQGRPL